MPSTEHQLHQWSETSAQSPKDTKRQHPPKQSVHPAAIWQQIPKYLLPFHQTTEQLYSPGLSDFFVYFFHKFFLHHDIYLNWFIIFKLSLAAVPVTSHTHTHTHTHTHKHTHMHTHTHTHNLNIQCNTPTGFCLSIYPSLTCLVLHHSIKKKKKRKRKKEISLFHIADAEHSYVTDMRCGDKDLAQGCMLGARLVGMWELIWLQSWWQETAFSAWWNTNQSFRTITSAFIMWGSWVRRASLQGCQQQHFTKHWLTPQATLNWLGLGKSMLGFA